MAKRKGRKPVQTEAIKTELVVGERERTGRTSATVQRLLKAGQDGVEYTYTDVQRIVAAPLDRMRKQGRVTASEFEAGDRYRTDAFLASIEAAAGSVDWNSAGGSSGAKVPSMFTSQHIADARIRWRRVNGKISGIVSAVAYLALVKELRLEDIGRNIMGYADKKDASVAGTALVRMACATLVDVYRA